MIAGYVSGYVSAMWPAVANHLWQSTLFAVAAGLLTLALRKNQARVRYSVWFAASLKFLIPFSLLINLGGHLARTHVSASAPSGVYSTVEAVSVPFTRTPHLVVAPHVTLSTPTVLMVVWLCGFVIVVARWCLRWRQVCEAAADAIDLNQGREIDMLRSVQSMAGVRASIPLRLSRKPLEPGIFGIVRPALLWPTGFSERLQDAHLEAILTHEVWHVRRRDNLAAAIHMLVEAVFWFHPLTWWLGTRLIEERERACDERVLQLGSQPQVYAESILKTCEFCMEAPLACVAGVTGADLRHRVLRIVTAPVASQLNLNRKFLLIAAAVAAIALPISFGLLYAAPNGVATQSENSPAQLPVFEVASIKPGKPGPSQLMMGPDGVSIVGVPLHMIIREAYQVQDSQVLGEPGWIQSARYDLQAKVNSSDVAELKKLSFAQRWAMVQPILAERFQLKVHWATKELPVYALVVAKSGPKLKEAKPGDTYPNGLNASDGGGRGKGGKMFMQWGQLTAQALPVSALVKLLSEQQQDRLIVDQTGLSGVYDFTLKWTPEGPQPAMFKGDGGGPPQPKTTDESSEPSLFTAMQEQLGLKLESRKAPVQVLVIDHVERPSAN
jgi:bla regulator protein BlaR1